MILRSLSRALRRVANAIDGHGMALWRTRLRVALVLDRIADRLWPASMADCVDQIRREIDLEIAQQGD